VCSYKFNISIKGEFLCQAWLKIRFTTAGAIVVALMNEDWTERVFEDE